MAVQTGKENQKLRRHKVKQHKRKAKRIALSQKITTRMCYINKMNEQNVKDKTKGRTLTTRIKEQKRRLVKVSN